ncbi:uncharacterized protein LOC111518573 isoform X2 [Drosophila willistoni]|nr:uncharacterized protein LOC111518573 isoform X2 [Drosophila willistoni]
MLSSSVAFHSNINPNILKLKCGNCMTVANYKKDEAGFDCSTDDMAITFAPPGRRPSSIKLAECLPPKFDIVDAVYDYCCFWSPHLGCTQVYGESYLPKHKDNCSLCAEPCGKVKIEVIKNSNTRTIDLQEQLIILYFLSLLIYDII